MCGECGTVPEPLWGRRRLLQVGGLAAAALVVPRTPAWAQQAPVTVAPGLSIVPRSSWGADLRPTRALEAENDVRFLLVHHTAGANRYAAADVPKTLRYIYGFHTGERGWSDVAYNFFVDRYGGVWEGRTGSLRTTMKVDATGGSQGFAALGCFLGDHSSEAPTPAAKASMATLLAWLANRHRIDTTPGATVSFTSRGSNRYPAGTKVTTGTIAGHREMSQTTCPGDAGYQFMRNELPALVRTKQPIARPQTQPASPGTTTSPGSPGTTSDGGTSSTTPSATGPSTAPGRQGAGGSSSSTSTPTRPGVGRGASPTSSTAPGSAPPANPAPPPPAVRPVPLPQAPPPQVAAPPSPASRVTDGEGLNLALTAALGGSALLGAGAAALSRRVLARRAARRQPVPEPDPEPWARPEADELQL